jgi:hypothetical protein
MRLSRLIAVLSISVFLLSCNPRLLPRPEKPTLPPPPAVAPAKSPPAPVNQPPTKPAPQPVSPALTPTSLPAANPASAGFSAGPLNRPDDLQIGLNFIRFYWTNKSDALDTTTAYAQPETIFKDFKGLGVQTYRQFVKADLFWDVVEPQDNQWNFTQADSVLGNPDFEPVASLFRMQYASGTPPWAASPEQFQKTIGPEARDYLTTVVKRYASVVKYWEIGNEMDHWRAADPGGKKPSNNASRDERLPASYPADGFSPQEQGAFLAQAAQIIRENDPDAVIVLPGISGLGSYPAQTWLAGVVEGGGKDWFDITNYHYYDGWEGLSILRPRFGETLRSLGIENKPVWCTETGSSSDPTLTIRTDYPNSLETQVADIFRRTVPAWGLGDKLVVWHTYVGSSDGQGDWRAYGIIDSKGNIQPSYYTFKLLTSELLPYQQVEVISSDAKGLNAYKITTKAGAVRYVAWGKGKFTLPAGVSQSTSVLPDRQGGFKWSPAAAGASLPLTSLPILIK